MENLEFSAKTRAADLNDLENRKFDVLIIGGGINGSGVANTLAQAGISTVLVEANDFASGTSSSSSKLIHGGLRYLQQGRIREVRNLIKERDYLRRNTQIVRDIEFHILITPDSWRKWEIRLGPCDLQSPGAQDHISGISQEPGRISFLCERVFFIP
ncbi:MAG: FAD dependent oxidoreductase [Thermoplasmatales archaeon A-plasma]|nr:MAG: FAD dependent oxidoreductase [Thermoplasmatales archaeon A-plasma]